MKEREALEALDIIRKITTSYYDMIECVEIDHRSKDSVDGYREAIVDVVDIIASTVIKRIEE